MVSQPVVIKNDKSVFNHTADPANSSKVFIQNELAVLEGDIYGVANDHPGDKSHTTTASKGSTTVFCGTKGLTRKGDSLSCGDVANTLPTRTVFCG